MYSNNLFASHWNVNFSLKEIESKFRAASCTTDFPMLLMWFQRFQIEWCTLTTSVRAQRYLRNAYTLHYCTNTVFQWDVKIKNYAGSPTGKEALFYFELVPTSQQACPIRHSLLWMQHQVHGMLRRIGRVDEKKHVMSQDIWTFTPSTWYGRWPRKKQIDPACRSVTNRWFSELQKHSLHLHRHAST